MFGSGVTCEIVVASLEKGEIVWDINQLYNPGVRLYFDARKIAEDGKLIRDGAHVKVKDKLNLEKYLIFAATPKIVDPSEHNWTPKKYTEKSDLVFREQSMTSYRIAKRWLRQKLKLEKSNYSPTIKMLLLMYKWSKGFKKSKKDILKMLKPYMEKVIILNDRYSQPYLKQN